MVQLVWDPVGAQRREWGFSAPQPVKSQAKLILLFKLADLEVVYCGWREVSLILSMSSCRRTAPEFTRCPHVVMLLKRELRASTSLRLPASDFIEEQGDRGKWKGNGQTALRVVFQPQHKASSGNYRITFI